MAFELLYCFLSPHSPHLNLCLLLLSLVLAVRSCWSVPRSLVWWCWRDCFRKPAVSHSGQHSKECHNTQSAVNACQHLSAGHCKPAIPALEYRMVVGVTDVGVGTVSEPCNKTRTLAVLRVMARLCQLDEIVWSKVLVKLSSSLMAQGFYPRALQFT